MSAVDRTQQAKRTDHQGAAQAAAARRWAARWALLAITCAGMSAGCKPPPRKLTAHEQAQSREQREMNDIALVDLQTYVLEYPNWFPTDAGMRVSEGHQKMLVETFVNRKGMPTYGSLSKARQGAVVAQHAWRSSQKLARGPMWFMIKMPPGYDAAFGDWFYAEYSPDGELLRWGNSRKDDISRDCIACHARAEASDFLFGARLQEE
jgi:hypothetical protein